MNVDAENTSVLVAEEESRQRFLVLGTAGHIDHGKTSLVRALTGIDTDRLPEEKKRGITIDLGFANLQLPGATIGVVDVPGHERFVHNMVAGATGINIVALVVAADDSVMPQTIEHLAILNLLGIEDGLVVITKVDLVQDPDHLEFVKEELRELLAGTFLEDKPVFAVSSHTGAGILELKEYLADVARHYQPRRAQSFARLSIDRVFSLAGHGTVVTGTTVSGQFHVGQTVNLLPKEEPVRIRSIQSHAKSAEFVGANQRTAINLASIKADEIKRGDELVEVGYLAPSRRLLVRLKLLPNAPRMLANRATCRLHIGTQEKTVRVILRSGPLLPGDTAFAELRSSEPILSSHGQRFILREISPVTTLGGGEILLPIIPPTIKIRNPDEIGNRLASADPAERLAVGFEGLQAHLLSAKDLVWQYGIDEADQPSLLGQLKSQGVLTDLTLRTGERAPVHRHYLQHLEQAVLVRSNRLIQQAAPAKSIDRARLVASCRRHASEREVQAMLDLMLKQGKLAAVGDKIGLPGRAAALSKAQQKSLHAILDRFTAGGVSPPLVNELATELVIPSKELNTLLQVAVEDELLVRVGDGLYMKSDVLANLITKTKTFLMERTAGTVSDLKEVWGVSRKFAVPICEYLDKTGITQRVGDQRRLGPKGISVT